MTVSELIAALQKMPQDAEVIAFGSDGNPDPVANVTQPPWLNGRVLVD